MKTTRADWHLTSNTNADDPDAARLLALLNAGQERSAEADALLAKLEAADLASSEAAS